MTVNVGLHRGHRGQSIKCHQKIDAAFWKGKDSNQEDTIRTLHSLKTKYKTTWSTSIHLYDDLLLRNCSLQPNVGQFLLESDSCADNWSQHALIEYIRKLFCDYELHYTLLPLMYLKSKLDKCTFNDKSYGLGLLLDYLLILFVETRKQNYLNLSKVRECVLQVKNVFSIKDGIHLATTNEEYNYTRIYHTSPLKKLA